MAARSRCRADPASAPRLPSRCPPAASSRPLKALEPDALSPSYAAPMPPPLLHLQDIHLTLGGAPLLDGAELAVAPGERLCLVGRNGSGKSTLLRLAAGLIEADRGQRFLQPGTTIRYLPQEPDLSGHPTTLAHAEGGLGPGDDPHRA